MYASGPEYTKIDASPPSKEQLRILVIGDFRPVLTESHVRLFYYSWLDRLGATKGLLDAAGLRRAPWEFEDCPIFTAC